MHDEYAGAIIPLEDAVDIPHMLSPYLCLQR
jgi:hypothetical protein